MAKIDKKLFFCFGWGPEAVTGVRLAALAAEQRMPTA